MAIDNDDSGFAVSGLAELLLAGVGAMIPSKKGIGFRVMNVAISIFGMTGLTGMGMTLKASSNLIVTRTIMLFSSQGFLTLESAAALTAFNTALLVTGGSFLLFAFAVHVKYRLYPELADSPKKNTV